MGDKSRQSNAATQTSFVQPHAVSPNSARHFTSSTCSAGRGEAFSSCRCIVPHRVSLRGTNTNNENNLTIKMQIPPNAEIFEKVPYPERDQVSPEYKWDPDYPGTLKPGQGLDNYPLDEVLKSGVYENMVYDEFDMDERVAEIFEPDEDLLEWLDKNGRLIPKGAENDNLEMESEQENTSLSEGELEGYVDDDSKMIEYYSKQSEGASSGSGLDFGGFSESSSDYDAGF